MRNRLAANESGVAAVCFALIAPILITFVALGGEAGVWLATDRKVEHIADVAAMSGAGRSMATTSKSRITAAATASADGSGMGDTDTITVNVPPISGAFSGEAGYAQGTITRTLPRYFSALFATGPVVIAGTAVAGAIPNTGSPVSMLALSPTASPAFAVGGSALVDANGCALASNSAAETSLDMIGGRVAVSGACLDTVGGVSVSENLVLTDTTFTPTEMHPSGIPSARFTGGLTVRGTVTLAPGLYIVVGGSLKINANVRLTGHDIAFFLTNGASLTVDGSAVLDLSARDDAPYEGLLFFSAPGGPAVTYRYRGNSESDIDGTIYLPTVPLTILATPTGRGPVCA
jgi:hypothetical protein